jgi:hypothetical protein
MNKYLATIVIILIGFLSIQNTFGQVYNRPVYEGRSIKEIEILKITINDKYTIVECEHINMYGTGWVTAMPNTFIRVSDKTQKYKLIKTYKIPVFPSKHYYKKVGEKLRYKLYFPPINPSVEYLDIIEIEGFDKAFNFYKVKLKPIA